MLIRYNTSSKKHYGFNVWRMACLRDLKQFETTQVHPCQEVLKAIHSNNHICGLWYENREAVNGSQLYNSKCILFMLQLRPVMGIF